MVGKAAAIVAALSVVPYVSGFSHSSVQLRRHGGCLSTSPSLANVDARKEQRGLRHHAPSVRASGTRMMTVIDALSSPLVLTAGAVGTMDGLGRLAANFPRLLGMVYLKGSFVDPIAGPVDALRQELQQRADVRAAILKICIAGDSTGQGTVRLDELAAYMQKQGGRGMIAVGGDLLRPRLVSALTIGEAMGMDTEEPFNYINYFRALVGSPSAYTTLHETASKALVEDAYSECKALTAEYAKTFYLATRAMPEHQARATWAIYAWCRRVDELVDGPDVNPDPEVQKAGLKEWMTRLDSMWESDRYALAGLDMYDMAFSDMIKCFPGSEVEPYRDMVRGMLMDVSDKVTYETWDELYLYCYRVASTVGLMTLPVMGTNKGVTMEEAREPAVALGIALQITNILRDVGEDARDRSRIYLPEEDLRRFGVSSDVILQQSVEGGEIDDKYRELVKFQIARAREYYAQAEAGIALLAPSAQLPVAVAMELYREILNKIELNKYDNLSQRAYLTAGEKLRMLPGIWAKTKSGLWGK